MKRTTAKMTAAAVAAMMAMASLSGCGVMSSASKEATTQSTTGTQQDSKEIHDLVLAHLASTEISTFNLLNSQTRADVQYLTNMLDGMVEADSYGNIVPGIATDWTTEDGGKTWTFHLRDNVTWVDVNGNEKAKLTADDFLTGMEWVLNFYKNDSANVSMPSEMIQGAKEYYEYTKTLSKEQAYRLTAGDGSKFREMVGIETPDDYTLVYHCTAAKPYFDSVMAYICMYPMAQGMVDELGVEGVQGMNNENMWYNGCYLMTSYVQGNEKLFVQNPTYWDSDCQRFDSITVKMVESNDVAYQLYQSGEVDYVELSESNVKTISSDEKNPYHDKMVEWKKTFASVQMKFNYDKKNQDGSADNNWNRAVANENFRKAWYYGLDFTDYFSRYNAINPMSCENNTYTMDGLCYTSDGTDYTELVKKELGVAKENGKTPVRLDRTKADEYKQKAIEELTAQGVTFPVEVDYYIAGSNQTALDTATVLKQVFEDSLGEDFVTLKIDTYVSSVRKEVYEPQLQSIAITGWIPDYGDPQNYMSQETYGNDNAYYTILVSNANDLEDNEQNKAVLDLYKEFTALVEAADAISEKDARYAAYAKAEAFLLNHAMNIPVYHDIGWVLTKINPYSQMNAVYGIQNWKIKNWETNVDGYSTEMLAEDIAAHKSK
ncbi:MAG: ABC transporter substrate-binding protein [Negativibacillus sp.]|nr:ABC transporter substrate-binding protein [Negativibacillus sp.]